MVFNRSCLFLIEFNLFNNIDTFDYSRNSSTKFLHIRGKNNFLLKFSDLCFFSSYSFYFTFNKTISSYQVCRLLNQQYLTHIQFDIAKLEQSMKFHHTVEGVFIYHIQGTKSDHLI